MRKMKKINGFLVVRFNDREKKNYPALGSFGVIDAEQYTGDLDIDRGVMEYDDAETIEIAVEQARGLNAEVDYPDMGPAYTLVVEDGGDTAETEIEPQLLIAGWEKQLETRIKSPYYKDVDPQTAAHELYGYKSALYDLGVIDQEARAVDPDHFAPGLMEQPLPRNSEELLAYICDKVCRHSDRAGSQGELDTMCAKCIVGRLENEASDQGLRIVETVKKRLEGLLQGLADTPDNARALLLEYETRAYLEALTTTKTLTARETAIYGAALDEALKEREPSGPLCRSEDDDGHHVDVLFPTSEGLAVLSPHDYVEGETFTNCTVQMLKCRRCGHESFAWSRRTAPKQETKRETFINLPGNLANDRNTRKVYALGLALAEKCPDNDCRVYLNIFNMARELDAALDELGEKKAVALPLRRALMEWAEELWGMYKQNYAIQRFKEEMKS